MVKRVVTEAHRRSARISALEERARVRQTKSLAGASLSPPATSRKRGRKRKSLQAVVSKSLTNTPHQEGQELKYDDCAAKPDQLEHLSSPQRMPSKQTLEFVLDVLQRRDRQEIFAQPVDGQEVVGHYSIIKEPMDFGTMRAKLQEGMYTSLDQFERDVFLISSNAMKFNSSTTVYFTEARAISELAQRLFHSLRTEPENFQLEYTRTRRRPGRKAQCEASDSRARVPKSSSLNGLSLKRNAQMFLGPSHSKSYIGQNKNNGSTSGARDGRNLKSSETDKRMAYMPQTICSENNKIVSAVLTAPKSLKQVNAATQYTDSLMRFVKHLGPTAQMVASKNLGKYPTEAPKSPSCTPALFGLATDRFAPKPSAFPNPAFLNGGISSQMPNNFLSKTSGAYKGKMVCTTSQGTNSFRQDHIPHYNDSRALRPNTTDNGITLGEEGANSSRNANTLSSSSDNMDLLIATLSQIGNIQNGHNHAPSGGYYPLTGHEGLPPNPVPQKNNREAYFTWLLNHPEPTSLPHATTSKADATSIYQNGGGQNTDAPAALNQSYVQPVGWKQPNGEASTASAAPSALDRYYAAKATQPVGWKRPNGEGPSSAAPYTSDQNYAAKTVQPVEWKLPNSERLSSAVPSALDQNYVAKTVQPIGWKLPDREGSSSAASYALDQNYVAKTVQAMGWKLPNGEGQSSAAASGIDQNYIGRAFQPAGWMQPNRLGLGTSVPVTLEQNHMAKSTEAAQTAGWKQLNGQGTGTSAAAALQQKYMEQSAQAAQTAGWKQLNGQGTGTSAAAALQQKYMEQSAQAAQTAGWKQLNGQGTGTSSAAALRQKYIEQSTQPAQTVEWRRPRPTSWGLPTICNVPSVHAPANEQITPIQQQSQLAAAGEGPMSNTMNFLGGTNSQDYQRAQTNAQLLRNRQQSSMNGNKLPDLDLQL